MRMIYCRILDLAKSVLVKSSIYDIIFLTILKDFFESSIIELSFTMLFISKAKLIYNRIFKTFYKVSSLRSSVT